MNKFLRLMGIAPVWLPDEEADDVIASYTAEAVRTGHMVRIVGQDHDLWQLLQGEYDVCVYNWKSLKLVKATDARYKFHVPPELIPDLKAIAGDLHDNISGACSCCVAQG